MKNHKIMALATMAMLSLSAMADDVPALVIEKTDGSRIELAVQAVRSIKFKDGIMLISHTDLSNSQIAIADVSGMTFQSIATAIATITGNNASTQVTITDLRGIVVYKGPSAAMNVNLHGTYIIQAEGRSHKVNIK